jgi:hypothetical protein
MTTDAERRARITITRRRLAKLHDAAQRLDAIATVLREWNLEHDDLLDAAADDLG